MSSFVADFPSSEIEATKADQHTESPGTTLNDPKETHKFKLFSSTWNVGGVAPPDDLNLEDWLDTKNNSYDIYVLGFQEIVPLSAKNVLGPEKNRISTKWNLLIRDTLNKSLCNFNGDQESKVEESFARDFQCVVSKQMVGILVSVWVRGDLQSYVRHPSVSCVGCGVLGCLGNKGSVSVRFWLHNTSFCFVCCHLASGGKEGDEMHRNSDAMEILRRTSFPRDHALDLPRKILDHDRIIWLGDLNYRISLPGSTTRLLVEQKEWKVLLENDQLRGEVLEGRAFEGWCEGAIKFSPTYKYYPNSDKYYGCDRILWHGKGMKQNRYDRCESRLSDHRPVIALFTVEFGVEKGCYILV
ncbi:Type IV inositol polyphosphate 5-phosphatase 9 [Ananas comosus]|uniref:Type IV inositol polyphosphate 5-phosphatase 9 n=1 Tax=Ananas comosus TaxID=4615 RepID=A0A199W190_ANACO|nr:Type IV inositol polyphosphate 5-phosphatase 9 [Ananas comosus]